MTKLYRKTLDDIKELTKGNYDSEIVHGQMEDLLFKLIEELAQSPEEKSYAWSIEHEFKSADIWYA